MLYLPKKLMRAAFSISEMSCSEVIYFRHRKILKLLKKKILALTDLSRFSMNLIPCNLKESTGGGSTTMRSCRQNIDIRYGISREFIICR